MEIEAHFSPNFNVRCGCDAPDLVVLHYTAMASSAAALERLCAPEFEVSAHYLIGRSGRIWQLVQEDKRAWHAGAGAWGGAVDVNSRSIGVEISNSGSEPFGAHQMSALEALLLAITRRWSIPPERVIAHSDCAPARKSDPGRRFDWRRLWRAGLAVFPEEGRAAQGGREAFLRHAFEFGYRADFEAILSAFRQRFRPAATGPLDEIDAGMMAELAARFPCLDPPSHSD